MVKLRRSSYGVRACVPNPLPTTDPHTLRCFGSFRSVAQARPSTSLSSSSRRSTSLSRSAPSVARWFETASRVHVLRLNSISEDHANLSVTVQYELAWFDPRLVQLTRTWMPVPPDILWSPPLQYGRTVRGAATVGEEGTSMWLNSQGMIVYKLTRKFKLKCGLELARFPFDTQVCSTELNAYNGVRIQFFPSSLLERTPIRTNVLGVVSQYRLTGVELHAGYNSLVTNASGCDYFVEKCDYDSVEECDFSMFHDCDDEEDCQRCKELIGECRYDFGDCSDYPLGTSTYSTVGIKLHLRRRLWRYMFTLFSPSVVVVLCSLFQTWLPLTTSVISARVVLGSTALLVMVKQSIGVHRVLWATEAQGRDVWLFGCLAVVIAALLETAVAHNVHCWEERRKKKREEARKVFAKVRIPRPKMHNPYLFVNSPTLEAESGTEEFLPRKYSQNAIFTFLGPEMESGTEELLWVPRENEKSKKKPGKSLSSNKKGKRIAKDGATAASKQKSATRKNRVANNNNQSATEPANNTPTVHETSTDPSVIKAQALPVFIPRKEPKYKQPEPTAPIKKSKDITDRIEKIARLLLPLSFVVFSAAAPVKMATVAGMCGLSEQVTLAVLPRLFYEELLIELNRRGMNMDRSTFNRGELLSLLQDLMVEEYFALQTSVGQPSLQNNGPSSSGVQGSEDGAGYPGTESEPGNIPSVPRIKQEVEEPFPVYAACVGADRADMHTPVTATETQEHFEDTTEGPKGVRQCPHCDYTSVHSTTMKRHMFRHTGEKPFACSLCNYTTSRKYCLVNHMDMQHYTSKLVKQMEQHIRSHTVEGPFKCPECSFLATERSELFLHIETHERFSCHDCGYRAATRDDCSSLDESIQLGETSDNEKVSLECRRCSYCTTDRSHFQEHIIKVHGKAGRFTCEVCGFWAASHSRLQKHMKKLHLYKGSGTARPQEVALVVDGSPLQVRLVSCTYDQSSVDKRGRDTNSSEDMTLPNDEVTAHNQTTEHIGTSEQAVSIKTVGVSAEDVEEVRHKAKPYMCGECGYRAATKHTLSAHMRKHLGGKVFECQQCGLQASSHSDLVIHVRKHTGEKPYKCPHCTTAFARKQNLRRHIKDSSHSGTAESAPTQTITMSDIDLQPLVDEDTERLMAGRKKEEPKPRPPQSPGTLHRRLFVGGTDSDSSSLQDLFGDNAEDEWEKPENRCGCGCCHPDCCQCCASPKLFAAIWAIVCVLINTTIGYRVGILATLEKAFDMESKYTGIMYGGHDAGYLIMVLLVSYYGGKKGSHRPKWIAYGTMLIGISCVIFALPYFFMPRHVIDEGEEKVVCTPGKAQNTTDIENCKQAHSMSLFWYVMLTVATFMMGIGGAPALPLGTTYIDDHVTKESSPLYIGLALVLPNTGNALGLLFSSFVLRYYVDFLFVSPSKIGIDSTDDRWIGAWWLGFLPLAAAFFFFSLPLCLFPKKMKKPREVGLKETTRILPSLAERQYLADK
ncbi:hypothetical protein Bbelb_227160, partial [Branchiostoma belcheri]